LIGQSGRYTLRYIPAGSSYEEESNFNLERWLAGAEPSDLISEFGIQPWQPVITPVISDVVEGGAAEAAGFRIGDTVTAVNGTAIYEWQEFVVWVQKSPGVTLKVELLRDGEQQTLTLVPASREQNGVATGFAGLAVAAPELTPADVRDRTFGVFGALEYGVTQTWKMVSLTISSIGKMLQGLIAIDNLSGPITIAKVASASADSGLQSFLKFMAYLSVSLGVLNLLPIPMLDGGHLVFFTIEAIRRRPVSERIQALAYRVGASLLFAMMAVAIFNDIARL
jgi:regulator of sigma E protease